MLNHEKKYWEKRGGKKKEFNITTRHKKWGYGIKRDGSIVEVPNMGNNMTWRQVKNLIASQKHITHDNFYQQRLFYNHRPVIAACNTIRWFESQANVITVIMDMMHTFHYVTIRTI